MHTQGKSDRKGKSVREGKIMHMQMECKLFLSECYFCEEPCSTNYLILGEIHVETGCVVVMKKVKCFFWGEGGIFCDEYLYCGLSHTFPYSSPIIPSPLLPLPSPLLSSPIPSPPPTHR